MNDLTKMKLNNEISKIKFPPEISRIDTLTDGYKNYKILSALLKIGLLDKMVELGPSSPRQIAETTSINRMFVRSILIALEDMGFAESDQEGYILTEPAKTFLCKKSPLYQGDLILSVGKEESQWNDLESILQRRGPPKPAPGKIDEDKIRSLSQQCIRGEVQSVLKGLLSRPEFLEYKNLLDMGGNHGLYSIGLCQENNALSATIIEEDQVVPLTSSVISEYGMDNRIIVQEGNIEKLMNGVFKEGYDVILISHLLYQYRREMNETLEMVVELLNPGGTLVLNHRFCSPQCDIKPGDGVREIDRALTSFGHPLCHPEGLKEVLEKLGLVNVSLIPHETALGYAVLCIGTKEVKPLEKTPDAEDTLASDCSDKGEDRCC